MHADAQPGLRMFTTPTLALLSAVLQLAQADPADTRPLLELAPANTCAWIESRGLRPDPDAIVEVVAWIADYSVVNRQLRGEEVRDLDPGRQLRMFAAGAGRNPIVRAVLDLLEAELGLAVRPDGEILFVARLPDARTVNRVLQRLRVPMFGIRLAARGRLIAASSMHETEELENQLANFATGKELPGAPRKLRAERRAPVPGSVTAVLDHDAIRIEDWPPKSSASPALTLMAAPYLSAIRGTSVGRAQLRLRPGALSLSYVLPGGADRFDAQSLAALGLTDSRAQLPALLASKAARFRLRRDFEAVLRHCGDFGPMSCERQELVDMLTRNGKLVGKSGEWFLSLRHGLECGLFAPDRPEATVLAEQRCSPVAIAARLSKDGTIADLLESLRSRVKGNGPALPKLRDEPRGSSRLQVFDVSGLELGPLRRAPGNELCIVTRGEELLLCLDPRIAERWIQERGEQGLDAKRSGRVTLLDEMELDFARFAPIGRTFPEIWGLIPEEQLDKGLGEEQQRLLDEHCEFFGAIGSITLRSALEGDAVAFRLDYHWTDRLLELAKENAEKPRRKRR